MKKITLFFAMLFFATLSFGQAMSGTYKVGTGEVAPNFALLSEAVTALNTNGLAGDVVLEITTDITEPADISLGVNTGSNKITIKPQAGVSPTITFQSASTTSIDGHFVIGSPNATSTNVISTNNVIIDGSNLNGGATKDLTIIGAAVSAQKSVIRIFGDNDNIVIKNCIITNKSTSGSSTAPINVTNFFSASVNYLPDNLLIDNNTLNSTSGNGATAIHIANSGSPTAGNTGLIISNNLIFGRQRGMFISYTNGADIYGNTISEISQASQGSAAITLQNNFGTAGTFNIYNNKITALTSMNSTAGANNGVIGIDNQCVTPKVVNIYNNMISGMGAGFAGTTNSKIYGIRVTSTSTCSIFNNTIFIPEKVDMTTFGSSIIAGIVFAQAATTEIAPPAAANTTVKNNILVSEESGVTMKITGIRRVGTNGTFISDNNNIYASTPNNYVGFYNDTDVQTLSDWQTASSQDANSTSVNVQFENAAIGDLRIAGTSQQDANLSAPLIASVPTDILGTTRVDPTYKGAHQGILPFVVTSVNHPDQSSFSVRNTPTGISVEFEGQADVEIYGINGQLIERTRANNNFDRDLQSGIYIIRVNGKSQKFVR